MAFGLFHERRAAGVAEQGKNRRKRLMSIFKQHVKCASLLVAESGPPTHIPLPGRVSTGVFSSLISQLSLWSLVQAKQIPRALNKSRRNIEESPYKYIIATSG